MRQYSHHMTLRTGIVLATLALVPLAACSGGAAATSAAPAPASSSAAAPAPSASATGAASPSGSSQSYTMADVAKHNSQTDCWAAIDGDVYDLTQWISRHPGGPDKIIGLCGTDATSAFHNQHDDQARPNEQLASFKVGTLTD
ncbi:conserved exported protein of unknown function [Micropruina glycogenica]|uniref:Cytochrome b5 heme-binding domain-containing protein n=2 Tax=Micropruina glycogenica TaxID=75385 RepID=A0A2N9JC77_9ACTN|nr:conserved exported protein of unknown function [Micropruina glycogenica]